MKTRIYFLDNLRAFLILLVVVLHAGIVYEPILENTWIVSDPQKSNNIGLIRMYLDVFVMFSLFFVSGYFIPRSLKGKTSTAFLLSKFKRIMLPWIVAVFTLVPIYKVLFLYSRGLPQEAWYTYFHIFSRAGGNAYFYADNPTQNWLWFLPVLFVFQVLYLLLARTKVLSLKLSFPTAIMATLFVSVVYSMVISGADLSGWYHSALLHFQRERLLPYFLVFLLGSLAYQLNLFETNGLNKKAYIWTNVILAISVTIFTAVALNLFFNMIDPARNYYFVSPFMDRLAYFTTLITSMFSFLYVLLYLFRKYFNAPGWLSGELSSNSYAVYIIHLGVIGVIATLMLPLALPGMVKFLILAVLSFAVSNVLVSLYRRTFQKALARKVFRIAIPVAAIALSIVVYAKQDKPSYSDSYGMNEQSMASPPQTDLHTAVVQGDLEAVRQHIIAGSNLDVREPSGGSSPLITAAVFGKTEVAIMLIEAGADVNLQNNEGSTPLHTAAFFCRTGIVEALLANGAEKSIRNNSGSTALESVTVPFPFVKGYYEYFNNTLGSMGLVLDYDQIEKTRPVIAEMLQKVDAENK